MIVLYIFVIYRFLNFCAGDVESAKEITILESSVELVGLSTGNEDQSDDIVEISDSAKCSKYLVQVNVVVFWLFRLWSDFLYLLNFIQTSICSFCRM